MRIYAAVLAFLLFPTDVFSQIAIFPSAPRQGETVRLQIAQGGLGADRGGHGDNYSPADTLVTMTNNTITVSLLTTGNNGFELQMSPPVDLPLGQFPQGNYSVEVVRRSVGNGMAGPLGNTAFAVTPRAPNGPLWNFTDLWWKSTESGWGLNLMQHASGVIFATWFVYAQDGRPIWYAVPDGNWSTPTTYQGTVYRTTGPYFGGPSNASVTVTPAGTATFAFDATNYDHATAIFDVDGVTLTKELQRQSF